MSPDRQSQPAILAELRATLVLAWPLILAQFATIALTATDVVFMAWLGPDFVGAGALSTSIMHPLLMFGSGVAMAVAPMIAHAIGSRQRRLVRRTARQGLWLSLGIGLLSTLIMANGEPIMRLLGQSPRIAALSGEYLRHAAWMMVPALMFIVLRGLVSAHGQTRIVMRITLAGIVLNALLDYTLMFGALGFPRLEMRGAGIATALVHSAMFLMLLAYVVRVRPFSRYFILVRWWKADWARMAAIWAMGAPIGLMVAAESGLFGMAAVMMGWLGEAELAAHAIAIQFAALAFMVPLGLSHATAVRVGLAHGRADARVTARAGWVSIGLSLVFMSATAVVFVVMPRPLITLLLDPAVPGNGAVIALAVQYLLMAAVFQVVDGAQVTGAASLRGIGDTRVPMIIALLGYWAVGIPVAWALAFPLGLEGVGLWLGLAVGLAFAAIFLCLRFARLTAPGHLPGAARAGVP